MKRPPLPRGRCGLGRGKRLHHLFRVFARQRREGLVLEAASEQQAVRNLQRHFGQFVQLVRLYGSLLECVVDEMRALRCAKRSGGLPGCSTETSGPTERPY
jgi:hypothetical protein